MLYLAIDEILLESPSRTPPMYQKRHRSRVPGSLRTIWCRNPSELDITLDLVPQHRKIDDLADDDPVPETLASKGIVGDGPATVGDGCVVGP